MKVDERVSAHPVLKVRLADQRGLPSRIAQSTEFNNINLLDGSQASVSFQVGIGTTAVPVSLIIPGCTGVIATPSPVLFNAVLDATGSSTLTLAVPPNAGLCGATVTGQHGTLLPAACPIAVSDALSITIGN